MSIDEFLDELRAATLSQVEFTTLTRPWLRETLTGAYHEESRRVIVHLRKDRRDLDPLELVALRQMQAKLIPMGLASHPLVAAKLLGLSEEDGEAIWRACVQAISGWRPKLRRQILQACNLSPD